MEGWISLYRSILDNPLWQDKPFSKGQAWIDLLLLANHKDKKIMIGNSIVAVERGSFITSELKLMSRWGWSKTKVRAFLSILHKAQMIEKKSDSKKTIINIVNYSKYQELETTEKPLKDHKKTADDTQPIKKQRNNNTSNEVLGIPEKDSAIPYHLIQDLYNSVCGSYPRLVKMSEKRKQAIRARMKTGYTVDDFKILFEKAEASEFLRGKNKRNWRADFDWLVCDSNMAKTLEGKYDDREEIMSDDTGGKTSGNEKSYTDAVRKIAEQCSGGFEGF